MAVHAHPDDESSKGAATMAKYVSEGVDVLVATCTGGERGSVLNPKLQGDPYIEEHIHEVRAREMDEARQILGVQQSWLGFVDSGLPEGDPLPPLPEGCFALTPVEEGVRRLVAEIRRFRCHEISVAAFDAAADPDAFQEAGEPWQPLKLYYDVGFSVDKMEALHQAMISRGLESPFEEW